MNCGSAFLADLSFHFGMVKIKLGRGALVELGLDYFHVCDVFSMFVTFDSKG